MNNTYKCRDTHVHKHKKKHKNTKPGTKVCEQKPCNVEKLSPLIKHYEREKHSTTTSVFVLCWLSPVGMWS